MFKKSLTDKQAFNMLSQGKIELNSHRNPKQWFTQDNAKIAHIKNDKHNKENFTKKLNKARGFWCEFFTQPLETISKDEEYSQNRIKRELIRKQRSALLIIIALSDPEIRPAKKGLVIQSRTQAIMDQMIETRHDCFDPSTIRLNCWAPKFCEVKVVTQQQRRSRVEPQRT